jgi:hypothetical protein
VLPGGIITGTVVANVLSVIDPADFQYRTLLATPTRTARWGGHNLFGWRPTALRVGRDSAERALTSAR